MIEKNVKLYLGRGFPVIIPVSQYDTMWEFIFTIINDSVEWTIPQDSSVVINGLKPDGNVFSFSGTITNNKVVIDSDIQMTAVAGHTICELIILSEGKTIGTANFILDVEAAPKSPSDISSESTLPAYGEILDQIAEMEQGGGSVVVDSALSSSSENPVQNKVVKSALDGKADSSSVHSIPAGGTTGQILKKTSGTDYAVAWGDADATEIEIITIGTATSSDIETAYQAGKVVFGKYTSNNTVTLYQLTKRSDATTHFFGGLYKAAGSNTITVRSFQCVNSVWGYAQKIVPDASSATPSALGAATAGSSDNFSRADHVHTMPSASDVGAIAAPSSPTAGQFLVYSGSAWVAQTVPTANGVSF